ncbi:hypothetical protein EAM_1593 [Erwinia amylovora ATCC 49946]|nr:hypothetical protein EAM_1593 [Erwinia amylovora ATCC 49946]
MLSVGQLTTQAGLVPQTVCFHHIMATKRGLNSLLNLVTNDKVHYLHYDRIKTAILMPLRLFSSNSP